MDVATSDEEYRATDAEIVITEDEETQADEIPVPSWRVALNETGGFIIVDGVFREEFTGFTECK